ncbi:RloB family protein [Spirosoma foliorum]|uniref:RloB domain-containing protein n=1 Tax=Spirosoma foliorum TaxID=2710596 RepID=A0A7G5GYE4_9BACT|nr:RloB family protein [Spirosoma foliorum]QMW03886.1 RloB domain-containing protein [Spirosoma foliorum]
MPRERAELIRISGVKEREKMFLLAYEGNETEPTYFEALKNDYRFNNDIIEIVSLRRDKRDTKSAPKYVFENLRKIKDEYNLGIDDELWMIIDRDRNRNNIEKYYQKCQEETNFFLALSNPCFELWLLLHIKDLLEFTEEELIQITENRKIRPKGRRTYLKKLLSQILSDGYNESNLRPERFLPYIEEAVRRAKSLNNPQENYPTGLGTDIYKLVEKLIY